MSIATKCTCQRSLSGYCNSRIEECEQRMHPKIPKTLVAMLNVKAHFQKTKERSGKIPCECGGDISYIVAKYNDHVAASCKSCGISFRE